HEQHEWLRPGGCSADRGKRAFIAWLYNAVEWPIPIPEAGGGTPEIRRAAYARDHFRPALPEYSLGHEDFHRASGGTVLPHRRFLAPRPARLSHERRCVGRFDRARRHRCRDWGRDATLS